MAQRGSTMKTAVVCLLACVWMLLQTEGEAHCCNAHKVHFEDRICDDCKPAGPSGTYCTSYGTCNIFACNCDGPCRTGKCTSKPNKRDLSARMHDAHDVIRAADVDGDGRMSLEEARLHLDLPADRVRRSLMELDTDKDDFLSAHEIDKGQ